MFSGHALRSSWVSGRSSRSVPMQRFAECEVYLTPLSRQAMPKASLTACFVDITGTGLRFKLETFGRCLSQILSGKNASSSINSKSFSAWIHSMTAASNRLGSGNHKISMLLPELVQRPVKSAADPKFRWTSPAKFTAPIGPTMRARNLCLRTGQLGFLTAHPLMQSSLKAGNCLNSFPHLVRMWTNWICRH